MKPLFCPCTKLDKAEKKIKALKDELADYKEMVKGHEKLLKEIKKRDLEIRCNCDVCRKGGKL
jgi:hypothetical protein